MSKKHCANCVHWGVKGSEEDMRAYKETFTQRDGLEPQEDDRWRWCARVWDGRQDILAKNGSTMALSNANFACEKFAKKPKEAIPAHDELPEMEAA